MKNRIVAASGAAFLLLAVLFVPAFKSSASVAYITLLNTWIQNGKIDNSPVGSMTPSTGAFTTVSAGTSYIGSTAFGAQGAYLAWNQGSGSGSSGGTNFVNNKGLGTGGFQWYNTSTSSIGTLLLTLDQGGNLNASGDIYSNTAGTSGSGTFHGSLTGNVNGNLTGSVTGNATTATYLATAIPGQCPGGQAPIGIDHSGNALSCISYVATGSERYLANYSTCNTGLTSTDGSCTGSVSFTAYSDTGYIISSQMASTGGAFIFMTVTGKSNNGFNYVLTCSYNCANPGSVAADIRIYHP
jgi:hypothetical protein